MDQVDGKGLIKKTERYGSRRRKGLDQEDGKVWIKEMEKY